MAGEKLSPELRRRLAAFVMDREALRREDAVSRFKRVETMVAMMVGLSDDQAAAFYQRMLDDAKPGAEREVVSKFVDRIRTARSAKRQ